MEKRYRFYSESDGDVRLDKLALDYLSCESEIDYITRAQVKKIIKSGKISLNGIPASKAGASVRKGDLIEIRVVESGINLERVKPYDFPLKIVYEDPDLLVIDKVAGIAMHPGAGNREKTVLNALVHYLGEKFNEFPDPQRLGIVHRLDQDTTGLVVVAKNLRAHNFLAEQFSDRTISRSYRALVFTTPRKKRVVQENRQGVIDRNLGRHPVRRTLMAVQEKGGRRAVTKWQRIEEYPYGTLLDVVLETGRTHQIRVHLESVGCPVIGDRTYGDFSGLPDRLAVAAGHFGRQALHAYRLKFLHPGKKSEVCFEVEMPEDFSKLLDIFRGFEG